MNFSGVKSPIRYFGFTLFLPSYLFAQSGWQWENPVPQGNTLISVEFPTPDTGYASGLMNGYILKTTNGGGEWSHLPINVNNWVRAISFADAFTGTAALTSGELLGTTDGGNTWELQNEDHLDGWLDVFRSDANTGVAVGYYGSVLRTTNGGGSWSTQAVLPLSLTSVHFLDTNSGTTVGIGGRIFQTDDGGTHWIERSTGTTRRLRCVRYITSERIVVVGDSGLVLKSTDGGLDWFKQPTPTTNELSKVRFMNDSTGIAVGNFGTILHTSTGGIVSSINGERTIQLPNNYLLEQNFPYPFNPKTVIRYTLSAAAAVRLSVFNLIGQEVATLMDEQKSPGIYIAVWSAKGFSSGVYFYRLTQGTLSQTKKLLLTK